MRGHVLPSPARSEKFVAVFREKLLKKIVTDHIRMTPEGLRPDAVVLDVGLLKQIAKVVYSEFEPSHVQKILTMEVDGVPLAVEIADEFNVNVAIAKTERDLAAEEFYEQRMVYSPDSVKYLYLPKSFAEEGRARPDRGRPYQVGDHPRCAREARREGQGEAVGIFTIASMEQSLPTLKERMKLNCPIETLVTLDAARRSSNTLLGAEASREPTHGRLPSSPSR